MSISLHKSGTMAPSNTVLVAEVLDMAETLEGFTQGLRDLRKQKNLSQTELGKLAGLHYTHTGRFERGPRGPAATRSCAWPMRWA